MIRSFRHKGLEELFHHGESSRVAATLQSRILRRLDALHRAETLADLNVPGFAFHSLHGKPKRFSMHVNGPWCVTFAWLDGDAHRVDLEQYH
ncbi:MAG: type II toxin-antitoxin system RelE/ParE family toxin [Alphaproteobacteria bacterium]